ncbi:MAG TPA: chemotaxis protein CheB, partial [Polyangiaceae bacterium]|nr:chemotaxis protein CheB [Polyangiaceae bacterium]
MGNALPEGETAADPDLSEQEFANESDGAVRAVGNGSIRVVGLGGSAGSIPALCRFFAAMPATSGLAFVVILHLAPEHESSLAEVLQQATGMPVEQARQGQEVLPDHVYV